jgi:hypothetical protein
MKWTDDDLNLALQDLSQQDPPPAALAALRARVLDRAHRPRPRWWLWTPVPAATLALALFLWPQPPEIAPPPRLALAPPVPEAAWVKTERPQPPILRRERPRMEATEIPGLVRVATQNPNIVIFWSFDEGTGDEE